MRRDLRPAFLLTVALGPGACSKPSAPPAPETEAAPQAPAASRAPAPLPETKRRKVRSQLAKWGQHQGSVSGARVLNPTGEQGLHVVTTENGSCVVRVPVTRGSKHTYSNKLVDCPDSMLDPAWDSCLWHKLAQLEDGRCVCLRTGNPPPPPTEAECPASERKD
jgi:hypothetical protein